MLTLIFALLLPPCIDAELRYEFERLYNRVPVATPIPVATPTLPVSPPAHFILPTGSTEVSGWYFHDPRFPADGPQHIGLDYACAMGDPIYAAAAGVVSRRGWGGDCGNVVAIHHDGGWETRYCHLSGFAASGRVTQGQVIGFCGSTGLSTGPHLHFEARHGGALVDPLTLP